MSDNIRAIVTDIEGTTSSLSFVKDSLFPYAYNHLPDYVWDHDGEIADLLDAVREEERNPELNLEEVIEVMLRYIDEDQKVTPLKTLQGMIWEEGYKNGELVGHIYDDALHGLKRWKDQGIDLTHVIPVPNRSAERRACERESSKSSGSTGGSVRER